MTKKEQLSFRGLKRVLETCAGSNERGPLMQGPHAAVDCSGFGAGTGPSALANVDCLLPCKQCRGFRPYVDEQRFKSTCIGKAASN